MAYSCVEVWFEIGHEASVRTKRTPEGFTHDWEVFVRGVENSDIHYFVDKVVFHLHETFPRPKRVIKEPPYSLKESGYAGFNLPIEVYFKNKDEPKKVKYNYDLHLQQGGPPISKIKREKYTFSNPSEDFRRKLIRGGGVGVLGSEAVGNSVSSEKTCAEEGIPSVQPTVKHSTPALAGKPKLSSETTKKAKIKDAKVEEIKSSNTFADLFGPPIKPDPKKPSQSKVSPVSKNSKPLDKTDKINVEKNYSGIKTKHIPQKEIKKESNSRDEKGEKKEKSKERERSKEKSSGTKHSASPPKLAKEEPKKSSSGNHRERVEAKNSDGKSERKKDKKAKDEKVKKDKHKDAEKAPSEQADKSDKHARENKEKDQKKSPKATSKEPEKVRDKEKHRDPEKDRLKHKHKKKEKEKYKKVKDESKERDKVKKTELKAEEKENSNHGGEQRGEKRKRSESRSVSPSPQPSPVLPISPEKGMERSVAVVKDKPTKNPLSTLLAELKGDRDTSDSSSSPLSGDEDVIEFPKTKGKIFSPHEIKPEPVKDAVRVSEKVEDPPPETSDITEHLVENVKVGKQKQSSHRDKGSSLSVSSKTKSKEKSSRKKERDSGELSVEDNKEVEKKKKKRSKRGRDGEPAEETRVKEAKEGEGRVKEEAEEASDYVARQPVDNSSNYKHKFSKEYLTELLDLQKKIMTMNDDAELQKVVQVLAQSGKYEINSKTFDVDLCALDKSTVKKLQEFFTAS